MYLLQQGNLNLTSSKALDRLWQAGRSWWTWWWFLGHLPGWRSVKSEAFLSDTFSFQVFEDWGGGGRRTLCFRDSYFKARSLYLDNTKLEAWRESDSRNNLPLWWSCGLSRRWVCLQETPVSYRFDRQNKKQGGLIVVSPSSLIFFSVIHNHHAQPLQTNLNRVMKD